jgi:hypothetical protein
MKTIKSRPKRRILSLLIVSALLMALLPTVAVSGMSFGGTIDLEDSIIAPGTMGNGWQFTGSAYNIFDGATVTVIGDTTTNRLFVNGGATNVNITLNGATIDLAPSTASPLELGTNAEVTLTLVGNNTISATAHAGILTGPNSILTINGSGSLSVTGGGAGAGIGGGSSGQAGSTVTINGGTVTATGGDLGGAGIGGAGGSGDGGIVTINGGTVTATGGGGGDVTSRAIGGGVSSSAHGTLTFGTAFNSAGYIYWTEGTTPATNNVRSSDTAFPTTDIGTFKHIRILPIIATFEDPATGHDVQARIIPGDTPIIYDMDVEIGEMKFTYVQPGGTWNPNTLTYTDDGVGEWLIAYLDENNNRIRITNRSNAPIEGLLTYSSFGSFDHFDGGTTPPTGHSVEGGFYASNSSAQDASAQDPNNINVPQNPIVELESADTGSSTGTERRIDKFFAFFGTPNSNSVLGDSFEKVGTITFEATPAS